MSTNESPKFIESSPFGDFIGDEPVGWVFGLPQSDKGDVYFNETMAAIKEDSLSVYDEDISLD